MPGLALEGRTALVTGASGGIGVAIARALHERGATVVLSGRNTAALEALGADLGERCELAPADLSSAAETAALAERCAGVDVIVANAALPASGPIDDYTPEQIDRALAVNLAAPIRLCHAIVPRMVERRRGHVVLVSSLAGKVATAGSALYSATKFGMRGFATGLREDLRGTGVDVTVVFPGVIRDAGMFADTGVELPRIVGTKTPREVASAVVRGIERGKPEIDVAPASARVWALMNAVAPRVGAAFNRRAGAADVAEAIATQQRSKR